MLERLQSKKGKKYMYIPQEHATEKERRPSGKPELGHGNDGPDDHLGGDPSVRSHLRVIRSGV